MLTFGRGAGLMELGVGEHRHVDIEVRSWEAL